MSVQSNVWVDTTPSSSTSSSRPRGGLRYIDWPGCRPLDDGDDGITDILHRHKLLRVVVMVDANQPARAAAESLWQLLPQLAVRRSSSTEVLVACHKQDLPKARNEKRIRIQLRNELERLRGKEEPTWWPADVASYEDLSFCNFTFHPTTLENLKGAQELAEWCRTGNFAEKGSDTTNGTS